jgi:hypothetical protein
MTKLQEDFDKFDRENPHIYKLFEKYSMQLFNAGRTKVGARAVFERIRWDGMVRPDAKPYKMNDHTIAYYARKFLAEHPRRAGLFELRKIKTDPHPRDGTVGQAAQPERMA